ncbi:glycosyltransferase family 4 protein [Sunxiuqinia elliptica]
MRVALLYHQYLDFRGDKKTIGGIQTYITYLAKLIKSLNHTPIVFQHAKINFEKELNDMKVYGYKPINQKRKNKELLEFCQSLLNLDTDLIIFCSENISVKTSISRVITIQHGIYWDIPSHSLTSKPIFHKPPLNDLYKLFFVFKSIRNIENTKNIVCVDHNFFNFYRSIKNIPFSKKFWIIPNFSEHFITKDQLAARKQNQNSPKIIFARRFQPIRGVKEFATVISKLFDEGYNFELHFYGEGPLEEWLKDKFKGNQRVKFGKYESEKSFDIHKAYDIAVVPSTASEGTSLSALEAMAAGCLTLSSNVGGLSNIIINNFNGLLFNPTNEDDLYEKLKRAIEIPSSEKTNITINAVTTVRDGFSLKQWNEQWTSVLNNFLK